MKLSGKTALVTGASSGIGKAIAEALSAEGVSVVGSSRSGTPASWDQNLRLAVLDLTQPETIDAFWRDCGFDRVAPDILINNAGSGVFGSFAEIDFEDWERQIQLMLVSVMKLSRLALRCWSPSKPGTLVNIGSLAVEYPIPYLCAYNAAKAGLAAFTESLQLEVDPTAARIMELRIGDVNTDFNDTAKGRPKGERQRRAWNSMTRHTSKGPAPAKVAANLLRAVKRERRGVVYAGSFFQAVVASTFGKFSSQGMRRTVNSWYYNLGRGS